jgi:hypothetical protein
MITGARFSGINAVKILYPKEENKFGAKEMFLD